MPRLLHDRYIAYDDLHGCDLATGDAVRLDAIPPERSEEECPALVDLLDDGQDGSPRWVVLDVRNGAHAVTLARRAAAVGRGRGLVPILVTMYAHLRDALAADLDHRTLLLIGGFAKEIAAARAALVDAAARTPRPHLLLTFRATDATASASVVREARAAYGVQPTPGRSRAVPFSSEVTRHLDRSARAVEFQRAGRHAAAERLLRDVAGTLARREAWEAAAQVQIRLGRLLLERGRAGGADTAFGDAARMAQSAGDEPLALDARVWQAVARTDAGRLTDAEAICRAVLLTRALGPDRERWAHATLARVLCWQGRVEEALRCQLAPPGEGAGDGDEALAATIEAAAIRTLLAAGDLFRAGLCARTLVDRTQESADPIAKAVALTAHLRVLGAAGDLVLAERTVQAVCGLARANHAPWRAVRARLIWHDALRRAGRRREAQRELDRLARLRRVAPVLLQRAIESRVADAARGADGVLASVRTAPGGESSS
ncbi:MAG: hypothetical protein HY824_12360, partial [Acidobacteria bacterium]|nr:hypothetical protein [Acidobacteriota bacterium]